MCHELMLPDGQVVASTTDLAALIAQLGGTPGPWATTPSCLCGIDVRRACAAVGLEAEPARAGMIRVPAQERYPVRYTCVDGPCAGAVFWREWGTTPRSEVEWLELGTDGYRAEAHYRLDGETYVLVSHQERYDLVGPRADRIPRDRVPKEYRRHDSH